MVDAMQKFVNVVIKETNRYGFTLYILRNTEDYSYDPSTGDVAVTTREIPVKGLLFDKTLQSNGDGTESNTLIRNGDKQLFILPPSKEQPTDPATEDVISILTENDKIRIGDDQYKVVTFKQINPSTASAALWELYIRK